MCRSKNGERMQDKANNGQAGGITPHDEAFKKLLQTFFAEFIELFLPELHGYLDYSQTRFLMQELLVDIVGGEARSLDLLLETRFREDQAYVLLHLEPQSYRDEDFQERMFIYFSRLFERHRKEYRLIIPIAVFTMDDIRPEPDTLTIALPYQEILRFQFLQVKLKSKNWRDYVNSDNPVAAALLGKMSYNKKESRQLRTAYLRMLLRLQGRLDTARLALIMSVADLYYPSTPVEDEGILQEIVEQNMEEGAILMELMPAWKRWGYEEGIEQGLLKGLERGIEQGIEQGLEEGKKEGQLLARLEVAEKLLQLGLEPEAIAKATELTLEEIRALRKRANE